PGLDVAKAGLLYVFAFHHVAIDVSVVDLRFSGVPFSLGHALDYGFSVSLLLVTFGAGALLFIAARRVAAAAGGTLGRRALHGMKVAPAYALCSFALSYAAAISIAAPGGEVSGRVDVTVSHLAALVIPLGIAAAAG